MRPENWIALSGILATLLVSVVTLVISIRREKRERERQAEEERKKRTYWQGNEPRLAFPVKLVDNVSILPKDYNFFFVEPGVEQAFTYVTKIPASTKYILAHAEFEYDQFTPHTTERVFPVKVDGD